MEHILSIYSLDSKLQIEFICSIGNRSRKRDIIEKLERLEPKKSHSVWGGVLRDTLKRPMAFISLSI